MRREALLELVRGFLAEDVGRGDRTTAAVIAPGAGGRGRIEARSGFVVAGLDAAAACFEVAGELKWLPETADGDRVRATDVMARIEGALSPMLTAERTALNLLARLSGVATLTAEYVDAVAGTRARIVDTRKTTPGLRSLEKEAVVDGGGSNHRHGLDDGILIKDNHVAAAGGVGAAVRRARAQVPHTLVVEVEVQTLDELEEALAAGAGAVLLDNMSPGLVAQAVERAGGRAVLEASGGITLDNVAEFARAGVDLISVGALTHSAPAVDVSLEVETWS